MWHRWIDSFHRCATLALAVSIAGAAMVTLTATASSGTAVAATPEPGTLVTVAPDRIADSRVGLQIQGPLAAAAVATVQVAGKGNVPVSGVAAVAATVTATQPQAAGYLTIWPSKMPQTNTSVMNFQAGQDISVTVVVPVGQDGAIQLFNGSPGTMHVIVDVTGYIPDGDASTAGALVPVPPARLADSRSGLQIPGAVPPGGTVSVQVTGKGAVPSVGVGAAVLTLIAADPAAGGYLTAWPSGIPRTNTSVLNFQSGQNISNTVIVPVGADGSVQLFNGASATVQLIVDVTAYTLAGDPVATGAVATVPPARIADSRTGLQIPGAIPAGGTVELQVAGRGGIPVDGVAAVVGTITVVSPQTGGYLSAWQSGIARPGTSNLNFGRGQIIANTVIVPVGSAAVNTAAAGKIKLFNGSAGTVQLILDVTGYAFAASANNPGPGTTPAPPSEPPPPCTPPSTPPTPPVDRTPPGPATAVDIDASTATVSSLVVRWNNPSDSDLTGVLVRRAAGHTAPASITSGDLVADTPAGASEVTDSHLAASTSYSYAVFAHDGAGNYATAATAIGTTRAPAPAALGVWSWGAGYQGELAGVIAGSAVPVQSTGTATATDVVGGGRTSYALRGDGTVVAWGAGGQGALGNGHTDNSTAPVQVSGLTDVTAVAAGFDVGYALRRDGTVWAWGYGFNGALGNNGTANSAVPVQVSGLTNVTAVAAGFDTGYALKADGTVWAWGYGNNGQLGNGSSAKKLVPVQVSGLSNVAGVAGGGWTGYALRRDGTVWAWGNGSEGELGNNATTSSTSPVQVSGLTNATAIAGGAYTGYALRSDGTVRAWGFGNDGQLGNGSTTTSVVPVEVSGLSSVTAIAAGGWSGYALRADGSVWDWGYGADGELGNAATDGSALPVQVSTPAPAAGIAAGAFTGYVLMRS